MALRRASAFGVARVSELAATAVDQGIHVSEAQAREALAALTRAEFLDDDWFWLRGGPNRLAALARRILAVSSPLEIRAIRAGVCRTYAQPQAALVPPAGVMEAFFGVHPASWSMPGTVSGPDDPLDYRRELGKTDQVFVEVLRSSWTGVLDQVAFRDACADRGMRP